MTIKEKMENVTLLAFEDILENYFNATSVFPKEVKESFDDLYYEVRSEVFDGKQNNYNGKDIKEIKYYEEMYFDDGRTRIREIEIKSLFLYIFLNSLDYTYDFSKTIQKKIYDLLNALERYNLDSEYNKTFSDANAVDDAYFKEIELED